VPLLEAQWERAQTIAQAVRDQLYGSDLDPVPFTEGRAEHVIRWKDNGADCKAMLDWLRDDLTVIDDLKTTGRSAAERWWVPHAFKLGYDVQAAFYMRGLYATTSTFELRWRWVVVETDPPYPVQVYTPSLSALGMANLKVEDALALWAECVEHDRWPGYGLLETEVSAPAWMTGGDWSEVDEEAVPF
jgi:hypothetical protein